VAGGLGPFFDARNSVSSANVASRVLLEVDFSDVNT